MKKLISSLKQIQIGRILAVFLIGLLVFVGTAFSSNLQALAQSADEVKEEVPETGATSPLEGGMNEFPDTEPRQDTSDADAKAKSLVNKAEQNVSEKSIDSPGEYVENFRQGTPLGERVQNIAKDVSGAAKDADKANKDTAKDISKGAQRGIQNLFGG